MIRLFNNRFRCALIIVFLHIIFTNIIMLQAQSTRLPVGAIPGVIDVSPMGAATYTIPIEVVPGTMGMQPNLSIVYNSFGGMGLLGMKWNLAGLSAITRCGQVPYYDNDITAINFGTDGRFTLDGERLINLSGAYGLPATEFATEMENFTRVFSYGRTPGHFEAYTDDGSVVEYGITNDSKHILENVTLSWYVNKITDANGNYMTFEYIKYGSEILIDKIHYTGNGFQPYAKVEFTYTDNTLNPNTYFVGDLGRPLGGFNIPQTKLLKAITVSYGSTPVRKYQFNYVHEENTSGEHTVHLKEIVLSDGNGTQLNATTIEWGEQNNNLEDKIVTLSGLPQGCIIAGDFNGDGYTDYVIYGQGARKNIWKLYTGSETGVFTPTGIEGTHRRLDTLGYEQACLFYRADITGDGCDNLIIAELGGLITPFRILSIKDGVKEVATKQIEDFHQIFFGDFDGSGTTDILFTSLALIHFPEPCRFYIQFYSYSGLNGNSLTLSSSGIDNCFPSLCVGDFNGDGKSDILVQYRNKDFYIYSYDLIQKKFVHSGANHNFSNFIPNFYTGDFNGDGITDILTFDKNGAWQVRFGGSDFNFTKIPEFETVYLTPYHEVPRYRVIIADINGDGKDDIIQVFEEGYWGDADLRILYSKGCVNGKYEYEYKLETIDLDESYSFSLNANIADFNNDGILDIVIQDNKKLSEPMVVYLHKNKDYEFVKEIKDGLGKRVQLNYKHKYYLAKSSFYNVAYPEREKKYFLTTVDALKISNGIGSDFNTLQYRYHNAVYSLPRRTFLGFEKFTYINSQTNIKDSCSFLVDYSKKILKPVKQMSFYGSERISEKNYTTEWQNLSNGRLAHYSNATTEYNILSNSTTVVANLFSPQGRLTENSTRIHNGVGDPHSNNWMHKETKTYSYEPITLGDKQRKTVPKSILTKQEYRNSSNQIIEVIDTLNYGYYTANEDSKRRLHWMRKGNMHGSITTSYETYQPTGVYGKK
ncbi:MAG: FG-GAP-like repeat-containing protein [Bacteroidetes bacterium]|nr:FG-GAP-like repeat-containing protein [Bacteroidota bacterium]MCL2302205.1 FG-GAP-like repeat-containing protein [Lentimicrobiaceae bacterium]MCL2302285.1 FG-GAP-like repeat-containing protein [Lentimicrobiaceae bacterium]